MSLALIDATLKCALLPSNKEPPVSDAVEWLVARCRETVLKSEALVSFEDFITATPCCQIMSQKARVELWVALCLEEETASKRPANAWDFTKRLTLPLNNLHSRNPLSLFDTTVERGAPAYRAAFMNRMIVDETDFYIQQLCETLLCLFLR